MSEIQDLRIGIRNKVLANSNVSALIEDRFYPAELSEVINPSYPCANFRMSSGARDSDTNLLILIPFRIWVWSELSYDEDYNIYEKIYDVLQRKVNDQDSIRYRCKEITTPTEAYDPESRLYYIIASWRGRIIKK